MSSTPLSRFAEAWSEATGDPIGPDLVLGRDRWLEHFARRGSRPAPAPARIRPMAMALAAAAVVLLVAGAGLWSWQREPVLALGVAPGAWLETKPSEQLPMRFAEGSQVVLRGESRVHVASVDPRGANMVVERGSVAASIVHRADTRWAFEAGPFHVRVTGTELEVAWDPNSQDFSVAVKSGSVQVDGPLLDGGRRVTAGQRCAVNVPAAHLELTRADEAEGGAGAGAALGAAEPPLEVGDLPVLQGDEADGEALPEAPERGKAQARQRSGGWRELEQSGRYKQAVAEIERQGLGALLASGSSDDLMSVARAARFAGRGDMARRALLKLRQRFSGSSQAATAAFLLGRSASPNDAARWFQTYLREQPGGLLAREASGRIVESLHRAGRSAEAADAARGYLKRYPAGPHAAFAQSVLGTR